jgi:hypothetical protein
MYRRGDRGEPYLIPMEILNKEAFLLLARGVFQVFLMQAEI